MTAHAGIKKQFFEEFFCPEMLGHYIASFSVYIASRRK